MTTDPDTLAAYAQHARAYADDWTTQPPPVDMQRAVREYFRRAEDNALTADIGCGSGRDADWLNCNGYPCIGYDASGELLAEARARFPEWRFEKGELPRLDGIATAAFDNVLCETVIMHLPRDAIVAAVAELRRILKPAGTLYLSWRVTDASDQRDARGRLYAAFEPKLVLDALAGMDIVSSEEAISASSGKRIHCVIARAAR